MVIQCVCVSSVCVSSLYYPLCRRRGCIRAWAYLEAIRPGRWEEVDTLQADAHLLLTYRETQTREESDRCEQNVNKHLLVESAAYFGLQKVINA